MLNKQDCISSNSLMNVLCLHVCRLHVPNIVSLGIWCFKKLHLIKVGTFTWYSIKICVIFGVRFERRKVDKESNPTGKLKHANSILKVFLLIDGSLSSVIFQVLSAY